MHVHVFFIVKMDSPLLMHYASLHVYKIIKYCSFRYYINIFLHISFVLPTQLKDAVQPIDSALKNLLYSMLSTEGSYKSQQVCSNT